MWLCSFTANANVKKKLPSTLLFYNKYLLNLSTIFPTQLTFDNRYRYKLPITITDDTGSIDTIAFSFIAEDLVERSAYHASQNMKIDATEHVAALNKAIGKTRLFYIGMSTNSSSTFSIKYVLRKSFPIENPSSGSKDPTPQVIFLFIIHFVFKYYIYYMSYITNAISFLGNTCHDSTTFFTSKHRI